MKTIWNNISKRLTYKMLWGYYWIHIRFKISNDCNKSPKQNKIKTFENFIAPTLTNICREVWTGYIIGKKTHAVLYIEMQHERSFDDSHKYDLNFKALRHECRCILGKPCKHSILCFVSWPLGNQAKILFWHSLWNKSISWWDETFIENSKINDIANRQGI